MPGEGAVSSTPATSSRHHTINTINTINTSDHVSPLKVRVKPKTPIAASTIHASPQTSPQRQRYERTRKSPTSHRKIPLPTTTPTKQFSDSFDDSFDLLGGMSPPVTMQFARAPRSSVGLGLLPKLGKTPKGEAADRIRQDLLGYMESHGKSGHSSVAWGGYDTGRDGKGAESSMSTVPTPPSLSRYTRHAYPYGMDSESVEIESSLESMMRRVGLNVPGSATGSAAGSTSRSVSASETGFNFATLTPHSDVELKTPDQQRFDDLFPQEPSMETGIPGDAHRDSDSDSDSFVEEAHNTAHPSAAFLMASQRQQDADDSFGSSNRSSDSLDDVDAGQGGMVHPFAGMSSSEGDAFDDDSFDNDQYQDQEGPEEETIFGVPPAQRQATAASRGPGQQLKLLGEDLLQDTIGIGSAMAMAGRVEESPTPYPGPRG
jgi:DASH complex subunit ASK1